MSAKPKTPEKTTAVSRLKPWEKVFLLRYIETSNGTRAMELAKPALVDPATYAHRTLRRPAIQEALEELWAEQRQQNRITVERVTIMLIEDREFAYREGKPSAAVSATNSLAKLHGLVIDRVRLVGDDLSEVTDDELIQIARHGADAGPGGGDRPEAPGGPGTADTVH